MEDTKKLFSGTNKKSGKHLTLLGEATLRSWYVVGYSSSDGN